MILQITSLLHISIFLLISNIAIAQYDSIPFNGYERTYLTHLPTGYDGSTNLPLVIAMHGGFGNAYNIENQSQLSLKADAENFIVVYPEGVESNVLNIRTWNAGWCCGFASNNNIDDVGFIDSLLNTLVSNYAVDTNRIYATGMSNGGFMSYRLACELSSRIAAIAPVASSMSMTSCTPARAIPIIHFHSVLDNSVPYLGGVGTGISNHYNSPIDSVLNVWSNSNACLNINDTIISNAEYTQTNWSNCDCSTEIHSYLTQDGGHSWPGGMQTITGDPVSIYINATDLMWSFFQEHSLDCVSSSISNNFSGKSTINIFPNPTSGYLRIQTELGYRSLKIFLFTILGEQIMTFENQALIDINFLASGTYLLRVELDGKIESIEVIVVE